MNRGRWWFVVAGLVAFAAGFAAARTIFAVEGDRGEGPSSVRRPATADSRPTPAATTRSRQVGAGAPARTNEVLRGEEAVAFLAQLGGADQADCDEACGARTRSAIDDALRKLHDELFAAKGPASKCSPDGLIDDTIVNVRYRVSVTPTALRMGEGRSIDEDLPADVRACLDAYLRHTVTIGADELGGPLATADFDTLDIFPTGDLREPRRN